MRLDHISYVTSHDQLSDTVQRLGSRLATTFVVGGMHPRFGTRNFTAPLIGGKYIEVVCPLDHPATEQTPWGKAVSKKALEGGGWLTWVFSTENIEPYEEKFGRKAVEGHRTCPDGTELFWKQIGVKEISDSRELPFFIQWTTTKHPSMDGLPTAEIKRLFIADEDQLGDSWFKAEVIEGLHNIEVQWVKPSDNDGLTGIASVEFQTVNGLIILE